MDDRDAYLTKRIGMNKSLAAQTNYIQMTAEGKGIEAATECLRRVVNVTGWTNTLEAMQKLLQEAEEVL